MRRCLSAGALLAIAVCAIAFLGVAAEAETAYASLLTGPADFIAAARVLGFSIRQTSAR